MDGSIHLRFPLGGRSLPWRHIPKAPPIDGIWSNSRMRFETRSRASGFLHSDVLWKEALGQAERGWLAPPVPIDLDGSVATYAHVSVNIAFRFGVGQADKIRACGDLKHNVVNIYCTVWTPIKLPTWGQIAQMCLNVRPSRETWEFPNTDHKAACKQLPTRPEHANLSMVALRDPITSRRVAFHPKALLFGDTSEVLRRNIPHVSCPPSSTGSSVSPGRAIRRLRDPRPRQRRPRGITYLRTLPPHSWHKTQKDQD